MCEYIRLVTRQEIAAMAETGKSVSWSWPSAIKDKLNQNIDQLINRLQQDSRTSKFFDFLFENRVST